MMLVTHLQGRLRQHFARKHPGVGEDRKKFLRTRAAQLVCRRIHSNSQKFDSGPENEKLKAQVNGSWFFQTWFFSSV